MEKIKLKSALAILFASIFSLSLSAASIWLLITPINGKASAGNFARCTQECGDGTTVSCEGKKVEAFAGVDPGCKCDAKIVRCSDKKKEGENHNCNNNNRSKPTDKKKP
jgi:hypothetical protein